MPKYFIKRTDYCYDDDIWNPLPGAINYFDGYEEYADAHKAMLKLEYQEFRMAQGFHDFAEIRMFPGSPEALNIYLDQLNEFSQKNFGYPFQQENSQDIRSIGWSMPRNATLKQVAEFRKISGIRFHNVVEAKDGIPELLGIFLTGNWTTKEGWMTYDGIKHLTTTNEYGMPDQETKEVPFGYAGIAEIQNNLSDFSDKFVGTHHPMLTGTPNDLSDQPQVFRSFIETTKGIEIDFINDQVSVNRFAYHVNWLALNGLLKKKIFELRPLPLALIAKSNGFIIDPY